MNAKLSVFVICVEEIIYLLLHNLLDCTFKEQLQHFHCFVDTIIKAISDCLCGCADRLFLTQQFICFIKQIVNG